MKKRPVCPCQRGEVPRHTNPGLNADQRAALLGLIIRRYWASQGVTLR